MDFCVPNQYAPPGPRLPLRALPSVLLSLVLRGTSTAMYCPSCTKRGSFYRCSSAVLPSTQQVLEPVHSAALLNIGMSGCKNTSNTCGYWKSLIPQSSEKNDSRPLRCPGQRSLGLRDSTEMELTTKSTSYKSGCNMIQWDFLTFSNTSNPIEQHFSLLILWDSPSGVVTAEVTPQSAAPARLVRARFFAKLLRCRRQRS